jgi:hypothetical protein
MQYYIDSEDGSFHGDRLRALPDPIEARNEIIPTLGSVDPDILSHLPGNEHEVDLAAYDLPIPAVSSSVNGPDAV